MDLILNVSNRKCDEVIIKVRLRSFTLKQNILSHSLAFKKIFFFLFRQRQSFAKMEEFRSMGVEVDLIQIYNSVKAGFNRCNLVVKKFN